MTLPVGLEQNLQQVTSHTSGDLSKIIKENAVVFQDGLGMLEGFKATLYVDPQVPPNFFKALTICSEREKRSIKK